VNEGLTPEPGRDTVNVIDPPQTPQASPFALAALLAALAMLGPFSIDGYLPAFPDIERSLSAAPFEVQQTLTAYLFSFAVMILWHGTLSDSLGRRNVILVSLAVFAVASFGCASAHSIGYLWGFRVLQGLSAGAGVVVGRTMIRDLYSGHEAQRLFSLVTMIFAIGPAVAPILGGWIVAVFEWRAVFIGLTLYTIALFAYCWRYLPETLPPGQRQRLHFRSLALNYRLVLANAQFHLLAGLIALNFAGLFVWVAASPTFLIEHLGLNAQQFIWLFGPMVGGIFLGALATNRLAGRVRVPAQVGIGFVLMISANLFQLGFHLIFAPQIPWSVVPIFFYAAGMAISAPSVTLLILDLFPEIRGLVASCQAFAQTLLASVVAGVIAPLLAPSVIWITAGQTVFVGVALLFWVRARLHPATRDAR
jgi:DHA1 family bicyclomycin/chloramphenicol resistance-like MFS transporter